MPYIVEGESSPNLGIHGEEPVLILIHGTGLTARIDLKADSGERWWQPGSEFDQWLCTRIKYWSGRRLWSKDILRFVWSGENSEAAREKAAQALLEFIRPIESAGRAISIIAHSHGGNIVRRACEMATITRSPATVTPWTVICIGTPFFHYGLGAMILTILHRILAIAFWSSGLYFLPTLIEERFPLLGADWYRIMLGAITLNYLRDFVSYCVKLDFRRFLYRSRFRDRALLTNLYSCRDEALALLRSLNRPVSIMRRQGSESWLNGPLGCAVIGLFVFLLFAAIVVMLATIKGVASPMDFFMILSIIILLFIITTLISFVYWLASYFLDILITGRLRILAFGNDCDAAMIRVEAFPWQGAEESAVLLEPEMERVAEEHITQNTASLWTKIRSNITPNTPLLDQDIKMHANRILTGDELIHTVYYRIEPFTDLIAKYLIEGGQWRLITPTSAPTDW